MIPSRIIHLQAFSQLPASAPTSVLFYRKVSCQSICDLTGSSGVNLSSAAEMAKYRGREIAILVIMGVFATSLISSGSAGTVRISQADAPAACTGSKCSIPGCNLAASGVYGCTGEQTKVGRCPGTKGYDEFKDVCQGGQFSIDWKIEPLRLQFRNTADDFEECLLHEGIEDGALTPPSARRYYFCHMGSGHREL
jgi:hypothetical protein